MTTGFYNDGDHVIVGEGRHRWPGVIDASRAKAVDSVGKVWVRRADLPGRIPQACEPTEVRRPTADEAFLFDWAYT